MKRTLVLVLAFLLILSSIASAQNDISVSIAPKHIDAEMGDMIEFNSTVTNIGNAQLKGTVAAISLIKVTEGQELPMDLEDWNAQKAVRIDVLNPKESQVNLWNMHLIDSGDYVIYMTIVEKNSKVPIVSEMSELKIARIQKLNPNNVLPVAFGVPILILLIFTSLGVLKRLLRNRKNK